MKITEESKKKAIEIVLERIAEGESLRGILDHNRDKDILPSRRVFNEWLKNDEELSTQYAYSARERADGIFEQILAIADNQEEDVYIDEDGKEQTNHNVINRARVRIDARKWMLGKMMPKKYGDRIIQDVEIKDRIDTSNLTAEEKKVLLSIARKQGNKG